MTDIFSVTFNFQGVVTLTITTSPKCLI